MNPDIEIPAGPADPTVTVVAFRAADGTEPIGAIVHFACHATHMNGLLYSADYPRYIVDTLRAVYGEDFGVVYLNGACGDVTQVDNQSPRPGEFGEYWCKRTGRAVGAAALQALAKMDYFTQATVDAAARSLWASIRTSTPQQAKAARERLRTHVLDPGDIETIYAYCLLRVEKMRKARPRERLEILGVRIADACFWGVPGEYFQEYAMNVRKTSEFPHTCCVELANGYFGYICTEEAFAGGGYEIRTAPSSYLVEDTGRRIQKTGERVVATCAAARAELAWLPRHAPGRAMIPTTPSAPFTRSRKAVIRGSTREAAGAAAFSRRWRGGSGGRAVLPAREIHKTPCCGTAPAFGRGDHPGWETVHETCHTCLKLVYLGDSARQFLTHLFHKGAQMIRSMTGFGKASCTYQDQEISLELSSVNHRYLDCSFRLGNSWAALEPLFKGVVRNQISRGKVQLTVNRRKVKTSAQTIHLDAGLAQQYLEASRELAAMMGATRPSG